MNRKKGVFAGCILCILLLVMMVVLSMHSQDTKPDNKGDTSSLTDKIEYTSIPEDSTEEPAKSDSKDQNQPVETEYAPKEDEKTEEQVQTGKKDTEKKEDSTEKSKSSTEKTEEKSKKNKAHSTSGESASGEKEEEKQTDKPTDGDPSVTKKPTESSVEDKETKKPIVTAAPTTKPTSPVITTEPQIDSYCTIVITCENVLNHMDELSEGKKKIIPSDGFILKKTKVKLEKEDSVFSVLKRTCNDKDILLVYSKVIMFNSYYIEGIHNLFEFDAGDSSGWMYLLNGIQPSAGCNLNTVKDGDEIIFYYTCEEGDAPK